MSGKGGSSDDYSVIGLFHPWEASTGGGPLALLARAFRFKANPRDADYMRVLFTERFPEGEFLLARDLGTLAPRIKAAGKIVLLYPDAIGQGWLVRELRLFGMRAPGTSCWVLNGRRRLFRLRDLYPGLLMRRFLERWMVLELGVLILAPAATLVLAAWDGLRGRR